MKLTDKQSAGDIRLMMVLVAVILVNLVGLNMFFRVDLTKGNSYTLSPASRSIVENLSEPLTVKVFFTKNLPAPYNNIERYLRDLLSEYAASGGRFFNYQFHDVSSGDEEASGKTQELARNYGINPVQVRNIEQDEVKFQRAYMGLALIHGDLMETVPAITSTEGLEYQLTSTIRKMSRKMSTLLGLEEDIQVRLYLSSSLKAVGPYINVPGISELPEQIKTMVSELNASHYNRIGFEPLDPSISGESEKEAAERDIVALNWNSFRDRRGTAIEAGKGYIGLSVGYDNKSEMIPLLDVVRLPLFGTQYQLRDPSEIKQSVQEALENIINVNEEIGYLADHGTHKLGFGLSIPGLSDDSEMKNFHGLLSEQYSVKQVSLKEEGLSEGLPTLIISGARETFSDFDLYQIDQHLMKGKNLALFLDSFEEVAMPNQNPLQMRLQGQQPVYRPLNTGLEKLLGHYGVTVKKSIVMDENSFKQTVPQQFGGGEQKIYFAPIIKKENINHEFPFLENIKGLIMLKASPVEIDEDKLKKDGIQAHRLFSSSGESWEMKGRIDFNPMVSGKPDQGADLKSLPLAYLLEGEFTSYFADKTIPEKPGDGEDAGEEGSTGPEGVDTSKIETRGVTIKKGKPAKILVIGSSEILKDNILSEAGDSPNSQLVFNALDYLNGREDYAVMRSKTQGFNPLNDVSPNTRALIKGFNIAGLPVLVVLAGIGVWVRRGMRKRLIRQIFTRP